MIFNSNSLKCVNFANQTSFAVLNKSNRSFCTNFYIKLNIGFWLLLTFSYQGHTQDYLYEYKRLLIDPSLSNNYISGIAVDNYGMVWLGSTNGLHRFDGYNTEKITFTGHSQTSSLARINRLACLENRIFLATDEGLFAMNSYNQQLDKISTNRLPVIAVYTDNSSGVWWIDDKGNLHNLRNNAISIDSVSLQISHPVKSAAIIGDDQYIWIAMSHLRENKLLKINKNNLNIEVINANKTNGNYIWNLRLIHSGNVCLLSTPTSFVWNPIKKELDEMKSYGQNVYDFIECDNTSFIVKDECQLIHTYSTNKVAKEININLGSDKPEKIYHLTYTNHSLFAVTSNGLLIVKFQKNLFKNIFATYNPVSKTFLVPRGIAEDSNFIYLATYQKLIAYDKLQHTSKIIQNNSPVPRAILIDCDTLWMATEGSGLKKLLLPSGKMISIQNRTEPDENYLICMVKIGTKHLLIGGLKHLMKYDKQNGNYEVIKVLVGDKNICESQVNQIVPAGKDKYWIATGSGIYCIDIKGSVVYNYAANLKDQNELKSFSLVVNQDESVWAGTANGILLIDKNGHIKKRITRSEGLAGNMVISMTLDKQQNIWAATFTGLSCFNPTNGSIRNFYKEQGLPDNEFNHSSSFLLKNGHIVLGSVNGFIDFNPSDISKTEQKPLKIKISKLEYGNFNNRFTDFTRESCEQFPIRLGKENQYIKLSFTTSPIATFENIHYEYKINGLHSDWVNLGNSPVLQIDNFKAGNYELEVRAIGRSGNNQIATTSYPLIVEQYFYKSTAFYVIIFLIISILMLIYLFSFMNSSRKIIHIRQSIARDLHDELGGYLTGITMNMELMLKNPKEEKRYSESIVTLGQKSLLTLKDSLWSLDSNTDTAQQLWDRVKELTTEMYENLEIFFHFEQPEGLEKIKLRILEKNYLLFIIKECLNNSIKYGDRKRIDIIWMKTAKGHQIIISNRTSGFRPKNHSGKGMYNIQNRMERLKGTSEVQDKDGTFSVTLNLQFIA